MGGMLFWTVCAILKNIQVWILGSMDSMHYCHTNKKGSLVCTCLHSRFSSGIPKHWDNGTSIKVLLVTAWWNVRAVQRARILNKATFTTKPKSIYFLSTHVNAQQPALHVQCGRTAKQSSKLLQLSLLHWVKLLNAEEHVPTSSYSSTSQ